MYLTEFRRGGVVWARAVWDQAAPPPEVILDEVDATLNSWKEAHSVFNRLQRGKRAVSGAAFTEMRTLVYRVVKHYAMTIETSYPVEAMTYALLQRWIEADKEEQACKT